MRTFICKNEKNHASKSRSELKNNPTPRVHVSYSRFNRVFSNFHMHYSIQNENMIQIFFNLKFSAIIQPYSAIRVYSIPNKLPTTIIHIAFSLTRTHTRISHTHASDTARSPSSCSSRRPYFFSLALSLLHSRAN